MSAPATVLFFPHGGGPLPLLDDPRHAAMNAFLRGFARSLEKPAAIVVVSAHWEERVATITGAASPGIIYDYYGFPPESYAIQYPCPGSPALAEAITQALGSAGVDARADALRGFDHGVFVPLKIMYPEADIPVVQLSLLANLDAAAHIALGAALQSLDAQSLLLVGSGFSFHNMHAFFAAQTDRADMMNESFESWLIDTLTDSDIDERERTRRLVHWEAAPHARYCHPRAEHLLPLHVCYGMAARACSQAFELRIFGKQSSMYLW